MPTAPIRIAPSEYSMSRSLSLPSRLYMMKHGSVKSMAMRIIDASPSGFIQPSLRMPQPLAIIAYIGIIAPINVKYFSTLCVLSKRALRGAAFSSPEISPNRKLISSKTFPLRRKIRPTRPGLMLLDNVSYTRKIADYF